MNLEEKKNKLETISKQSFLLQNFDKVELFPSKKEEFLGVITLTKKSIFKKNNYFVVDEEVYQVFFFDCFVFSSYNSY